MTKEIESDYYAKMGYPKPSELAREMAGRIAEHLSIREFRKLNLNSIRNIIVTELVNFEQKIRKEIEEEQNLIRVKIVIEDMISFGDN